MDPLIGATLGSYQIISEIGRGGMGIVYKAYQRSLNRHVALKVLSAHITHDRLLVERFLHEARIAAGLNHPNIITIFEVSDTAPYFIAMQYVEGETLSQIIRRERALTPQRASDLFAQVAKALDFAHSRGVIHRDIKPSNILVDGNGRAVLTDFGIARASSGTQLTTDGSVLGTPEYMAPEEIQGAPATARSDIYALGVILYEMLTGKTPFHAETPLATLHLHVYQAPPPIRQNNPNISPEVERVVQKALSKQPERRYSSASEMASELAAAVSGTSRSAASPILPWLAAALIIILIALGVGWFFYGSTLFPPPVPTPANSVSGGLPRTTATAIIAAPSQTPFVVTATSPPTIAPTHTLFPTFTPMPPTGEPTQTLVPTPLPTITAPPQATLLTNTAPTLAALSTNTARPPIASPTNTARPPIASPTNTARPPTAPPTTTAPPPTLLPTNTAPPQPTLTPRPTETPTLAEIPIPSETPTLLPRGVWATNVESVPPHVGDRGQVIFVVRFLNTTDGDSYFNWCVEIFQKGQRSKAFSNTECRPQTIPAGETIHQTQGYRTGCGEYEMRVIYIDSNNVRLPITLPDLSTYWGSFGVCP